MNLLYDLPFDIKILILNICSNNYQSAYYILTGYFPPFRIGDKKIFKSKSIIEDAIKYDNVNLIELLVVSNIFFEPRDISSISAEWGSFNILKWSQQNNYPMYPFAASTAARNYHFEMVKVDS